MECKNTLSVPWAMVDQENLWQMISRNELPWLFLGTAGHHPDASLV